MQWITLFLFSLFPLVSPAELPEKVVPVNSGDLTISIENLKNTKGQVGILIFNTTTGFPSQRDKALKDILLPITGKNMDYTFKGLPYGTYAVSVMHDENKNRVLDTNLFGIPKEGNGVSNNVVGIMGPPKFEKAAFQLQKNQYTIQISMRY